MKNILPFVLILIILQACTVSEAPEFQEINNFKVSFLSIDQIQVTADTKFHNPNDIGCELVKTDIDVITNGINVGKVSQTEIISIDNNSDFIIPTSISFSPKDVFKKDGGILNGALNAFTSKEIEIQYIGSVTLRKAGVPFEIEVDETQKVPLKK